MRKRFFCMLLAVLMAMATLLPMSVSANTSKSTMAYQDVQPWHWYYNAVSDVHQKNLMSGYSEVLFGAEDNLQRAQFATILWRIAGSPDAAYKPAFSDVANNQFYTKAVMWASQKGIIAGYANSTKFGSFDNITREQLATMMYRYANYVNRDTKNQKSLSQFKDASEVSPYAKNALQWCVAEGIVSGDGATGKLLPQGNSTRAVCASIISRFVRGMGNVVKEVTFQREYVSGLEQAAIKGLDSSGVVVWTYTVGPYEVGMLDSIQGIGIKNGKYYLNDRGCVVALDMNTGNVVWRNDQFMGMGDYVFGDDGTLYLCGYLGPDFMAIDPNGKTLCLIEFMYEDYYWAYDIEYYGDYVVVMMEGVPEGDGEPVPIYINLSDYSYSLQ